MLCTMQGDVWRVEGLDDDARRTSAGGDIASGLHQALGLVVAEGKVHVLGRDQITRLHDLNGDGEADFYECVSNAYETSPAGHDFISGLQRDASGRFYTASGKQGLLRISADGRPVEVAGDRLPQPRRPGPRARRHAHGPVLRGGMDARVDDLRGPARRPLRLPRAAATASRPTCRWSICRAGWTTPAAARSPCPTTAAGRSRARCSTSPSARARYFLLLREKVDGQPQGAAVPAARRVPLGRAPGPIQPQGRPALRLGDGRLGHLHRRSTAASSASATPASRCSSRSHSTPTRTACSCGSPGRSTARSPSDPKRHFAQAWNYRYSAAYGSPELSPRHPGQPGHDALAIRSAHVLADGRTLFLEIPELAARQPAPPAPAPGRRPSARPVRHGPQAGAAVHRVPGLPPGAEDDRRPPDPGRHGRADAQAGAEPVAASDPAAPGPSRSRPART